MIQITLRTKKFLFEIERYTLGDFLRLARPGNVRIERAEVSFSREITGSPAAVCSIRPLRLLELVALAF